SRPAGSDAAGRTIRSEESVATRDASVTRPERSALAVRIRLGDWLFAGLAGLAAVVVFLIIVGLFYELISRSWPSIHANGFSFIWSTRWDAPHLVFGAGAFIIGTLITAVGALI